MISSYRGRIALRVLAAFYWLGIFTLTHLPPSELPKTKVSDKFAHFTVYSLLCVLLYVCLWSAKRSIWRTAGLVIAIALIYGALDELTQPFFGRDCSLYDWFADAGGTLTVVTILTIIRLLVYRTGDSPRPAA